MSGIASQEVERWLETRARQKRIAIVMDSSVNGLSFARSLAQRGVSILMLDSEPLLGAFTRHAKFVLLPPVASSPEVWLALLEFVGTRQSARSALFVTSDASVSFVAKHENFLRRYFCFVVPDAKTVEQLLNKRDQYHIAQAVGIPIPPTAFPESPEEVHQIAERLNYPCLLKPHVAHLARKRLGGRKVLIVHSPRELTAMYVDGWTRDVRFVIQEIVPGNDSAIYGYLGFWDEHNRERAWVTVRKLRQNPPGFGNGSLIETTPAPAVAEYSRQLLRALDYRGFVEVEFKLDARDQSFRLMEINPRSSSFNELAIDAGIDFPWLGYRYLTEGDPAVFDGKLWRAGVKSVNEEWDLQAFFALYQAGDLNFRGWVRSIWGARLTLATWSDPLPLGMGLWRALRVLLCAIFRTAGRHRTERIEKTSGS